MIFDTHIKNDNASQKIQQYIDSDVVEFVKLVIDIVKSRIERKTI